MKWTKDDLVQHATSFASSLGLPQLPALPKRTLGKSLSMDEKTVSVE